MKIESTSDSSSEHLKEEFLNTISHELRTPLSGIKLSTDLLEIVLEKSGVLEILEDDTIRNSIHRYITTIRDECNQEIRLINNLIMLQQLEADGYEVLEMPFDVCQWIREILSHYSEIKPAQNSDQHGVDFQPSAEHIIITSDLSALSIIINELLDNAFKFTSKDERIFIRIDCFSDSTRLSFRNASLPIRQESLANVFDAFYRLPTDDPWQFGGIGIGLSLAQKLARLLGGDLWIDHADGKTIVTLVLPNQDGSTHTNDDAILESYVAYFLSRGKAIATPSETLSFEGQVYQYWGYHRDFLKFWHHLKQRHDFHQLYMDGDVLTFGEFLRHHYTLQLCGKCVIPVAVPSVRLYSLPTCSLCEVDDQPDTEPYALTDGSLTPPPCQSTALNQHQSKHPVSTFIVIQPQTHKPQDEKSQYQKSQDIQTEFQANNCHVVFYSSCDDICLDNHLNEVELIILDGVASQSEAIDTAKRLRRHTPFHTTPIIALSQPARCCLPWQESEMTFKHYILNPLSGKRLSRYLRSQQVCLDANTPSPDLGLHWFPA